MSENVATSQLIHSEIYGEIMVDHNQIYSFAQGIVGFSHLNKFALLPLEDTDLFVLQSFSEELSLMLFPALLSDNHISFQIDELTIEQLGITSQDDLVIFYVLRFIDKSPFINVRAPILVVPKTQKGCQYVISNEALSVREPLVIKGDASC